MFVYFKYEDGTEYHVGLDTNLTNNLKITFAQKVHSIRMVIDGLTSGTEVHEKIGFQLEEGSTATSYVPYLNLEKVQENAIVNFSFFQFLIILSLSYRSEQFHLLFYGSLDCFSSGC